MKLFKKVSAMVVSLLMALAMMVPVAAADSSITIKNVKKGEEFNYVQIVKVSTTTTSGWEFVNKDIEKAFTDAFENKDANAILKQITAKGADKKVLSSNLKKALENVKNLGVYDGNVIAQKDGDLTITKPNKGAYAIFGVDKAGEYTYSPMMVYVEKADSNVKVTSKKETMKPSKEVADEDNVVEIGKVVEYTITTTVPFNDGTHTQFIAKDTLTGANYNLVDGKVAVKATLGDKSDTLYAEVNEDNDHTFVLDLTGFTEFAAENTNANSTDRYSNKYAGMTLTLKYSVTVTGQEVNNTINMGDGENDTKFGTDDVDSTTTTITVTKTGEDKEKLNGAGFIVYKKVDGVNKYAQFDDNGVLTGYVDNEDDATIVYTEGEDAEGNANGTKTIYGLDSDLDYFFKEVVAPEGYTVPEEDEATKPVDFVKSNGKLVGSVSFSDTKVGSLPETGGIGTTIFTVGGCAIMVVAAALFFMNKKKQEK